MSDDWGWWGSGLKVVDWAVELEDALSGQHQIVKVQGVDETHARTSAQDRYPGFHVLSCKRVTP